MVLVEERTDIVEQRLSLTHLSDLRHLLNTFDSLLFQITSKFTTHSGGLRVCCLIFARARRRYEAHLASLFDQIFVLALQRFILIGQTLGHADPGALLLIYLFGPAPKFLSPLNILHFDGADRAG